MLPGSPDKPNFPLNLLADFAGGGMVCVLGILLALVERGKTGHGQIVDVDMVNLPSLNHGRNLLTWLRFLVLGICLHSPFCMQSTKIHTCSRKREAPICWMVVLHSMGYTFALMGGGCLSHALSHSSSRFSS